MTVLQISNMKLTYYSPLHPHLAQSQILWPVEYLTNIPVNWSRLSIKSRSLRSIKADTLYEPFDINFHFFQYNESMFSCGAVDRYSYIVGNETIRISAAPVYEISSVDDGSLDKIQGFSMGKLTAVHVGTSLGTLYKVRNQNHHMPNCWNSILILSFQIYRPGQTVQTQIKINLIKVYTVCLSVCIFWMPYSIVKAHS